MMIHVCPKNHINLLMTSMFAFWIMEDMQNTIISLTSYGLICNMDETNGTRDL